MILPRSYSDVNTTVVVFLKNGGKECAADCKTELKKAIGSVSQKVLTAQLRDMEEKGLLTRKVYAEVPPRVEYTLTETGYSLRPILDSMVAWGTDYQRKNGGGR